MMKIRKSGTDQILNENDLNANVYFNNLSAVLYTSSRLNEIVLKSGYKLVRNKEHGWYDVVREVEA